MAERRLVEYAAARPLSSVRSWQRPGLSPREGGGANGGEGGRNQVRSAEAGRRRHGPVPRTSSTMWRRDPARPRRADRGRSRWRRASRRRCGDEGATAEDSGGSTVMSGGGPLVSEDELADRRNRASASWRATARRQTGRRTRPPCRVIANMPCLIWPWRPGHFPSCHRIALWLLPSVSALKRDVK